MWFNDDVRGVQSPDAKLPVILCIDVEPDPRQPDPAHPAKWEGFEATVDFLSDMRPRLEETTGSPVTFNWFLRMDPQVERVHGSASWVVQHYGQLVKQLERAGDEIGLHTHAWRWDETARQWITDHGDQRWVEHCVRTSFRTYEESFGRACRSFRFGDRWMNNDTMHLLAALGVECDLTLEPGIKDNRRVDRDELVTGSLADYVRTPRVPFRPSRKDFRRNGDSNCLNLWCLPLSTGPRLVIRNGRLASIRRAVARFRCRHQPITLNFSNPAPEFSNVLNRLLADNSTTYLAPVARTDISIKPEFRTKFKRNIETLISHPRVERFAFVNATKAIKLLSPEFLPNSYGVRSAARLPIHH
ncbi:MAG TPA: hypothetical protein VIT88_12000 [Pyrinomonadaceae bacterium]